jgi:hypothetical protein
VWSDLVRIVMGGGCPCGSGTGCSTGLRLQSYHCACPMCKDSKMAWQPVILRGRRDRDLILPGPLGQPGSKMMLALQVRAMGDRL